MKAAYLLNKQIHVGELDDPVRAREKCSSGPTAADCVHRTYI